MLCQLGDNYHDFMSRRRRLELKIRVSPNGKVRAPEILAEAHGKGTGVGIARHDYPESTNVSSPVQAASRRRTVRKKDQCEAEGRHANGYARDDFVVSDEEDDGFENVRVAGKPRREPPQRQLGPPITIDEKMARLNPTHRDIVNEFVYVAKKECERVS